MQRKKRGPRKGKEVRMARSIRIEPSKKELIESKYGSLQKWFDKCLEDEIGDLNDVEIIKEE